MTTIMQGTTTRRWLSSFCVMVLFLVVSPTSHAAQSLGRLTGVVISVDSAPLGDATVRLMGTDLAALTDADGRFSIAGVHSGVLLIQVKRIGYASVISRLDFGSGETLAGEEPAYPKAVRFSDCSELSAGFWALSWKLDVLSRNSSS